MENLKIHVANEAESKEAQELFFKLGYKWLHLEQSCRSGFGYLVAWSTGCFTNVIQCGCGAEDAKEITIQELRDMVNPMKEYLEKQADGSYKLMMRGVVKLDDDIEVPNGCNIITREYRMGSIVYFHWKSLDSDEFFLKDEKRWDNNFNETLSDFIKKNEGDVEIIWQRHTQPEELPFVDSLNDQYAEIEQVRQQTIEATLAERQAQYGCFEDVAFVTENIMAVLSKVRTNGLNDLPYPHRMALYMIASKMARIVNGDFNHKDSWHDIGGYSKLIEGLL